MQNVKITYNGESFDNIKDAILRATMNNIRNTTINKIKSFEDELITENSIVSVDMFYLDDSKINTRLHFDDNISEDLKNRIVDSIKK